MTEKKTTTFDMPCLCISFAVALCALFYTDPEYPISTTLGYFLSGMVLFGWLRLCAFVVRWCVTRTVPYWRWRSIVLHTACFFAVCGGVVLESGGPGVVVVGEIVGFIGVWLIYGILRFIEDFGEASNREDAVPRTAAHQAAEDAESLTIPHLDAFNFGDTGGSNRRTISQILAAPSQENLRALVAFVEVLPPPARARYRRGNTSQLAAAARELFENAVLTKTFGGFERGQLLFQELADGTLKPTQNTRALLIMLPHLAKFDAYVESYNDDVQALSISSDVAIALHYLSQLRGDPNNFTVGQTLGHLHTDQMLETDVTPEALALMKAIAATRDAGPIANIVINYIGQTLENITASGVSVSEQGTSTGEPIPYVGASKLDTLNAVITEATTPKQPEGADVQGSMEGLEDDADTGGNVPASDGDPDSDEPGAGDVGPDNRPDRVGVRGGVPGGRTDAGEVPTPDEPAGGADAESDRGTEPDERTPGSQPDGTRPTQQGGTPAAGKDPSGTPGESETTPTERGTLADRVRARREARRAGCFFTNFSLG